MLHEYTKAELNSMDTIEQAWDGDELKIKTDTHRIWLVLRENRMFLLIDNSPQFTKGIV